MRLRRVALICGSFIALVVNGFADSTADWQSYTDRVLQVTFRYPKEWKTNPAYHDRLEGVLGNSYY